MAGTMSTSPNFPMGSDPTDRPLSVYDNLSSGHIPNGNRDYPKSTTNGHPLTNISFQFDNLGIDNGSSSSSAAFVSQPPIKYNSNLTSKKPTMVIITAPEVNVDVVANNSEGLTMNTFNDRFGQLSNKSLPQLIAINPRTDSSDSNVGNITTAKPVISDAKSKFFGLTTSDPSASGEEHRSEINVPLLSSDLEIVKPPVQMTTNEHKYQNIPPNSAIFRKVIQPDPMEAICEDVTRPYNNDHITITSDFPVTLEKALSGKQSPDDDIGNHSNRSTKSFQADMEFNFSQQQPSQVIYMSTTVPQNIKGPNIAGRHTPTRNSLRHSRMLVVNKTYQGLDKTNPLNLKHPKVARILLILLLILGLMITCIGIWILLWAPYTRMQDNPYWSGLSLILAGTLGLIVIKFRRIKRQKIREHCFTFLKLDSIMLTMIACILCLAAFSCASLHLNNLFSPNTKCESTNIFIANASCICIFGARDTNFTPPNGISTNRTQEFFSGGYEFHYKDLSCSEVNGAWRHILIISIVLNVLGFFLGSCYILLACFKKTAKRKNYNTVETNSV